VPDLDWILKLKRFLSAAIAAFLLAISGACGELVPSTVSVKAVEYSYSGLPSQISGGVVSFKLSNKGEQLHEFTFARIDGNHTVNDVKTALAEGGELPSWIQDQGGVPALTPGKSVTVTRTLDQGAHYVFTCLIPTSQGKPHFRLGMIAEFKTKGLSHKTLPTAQATILATDDGYQAPQSIASGQRTISFLNSSSGPQQFIVVNLAQGKTLVDLDAWLQAGFRGEAPATFVGGIQTIAPKASVVEQIDLERGATYTLVGLAGQTADFSAR
jgi:uncharacterized cupredoxin-like copper-binding protein